MKRLLLAAALALLVGMAFVDVVKAQTPTPTPTSYYVACAENITDVISLDPDWVAVCAECLLPDTPTPFVEMTPFPTFEYTGTITGTVTPTGTATITPTPTVTPTPSPTVTPHLYYKSYNASFSISNGNCSVPTTQLVSLLGNVENELRGIVGHWSATGNAGNLGLQNVSGSVNGGASGVRDRALGSCYYLTSSAYCNSANVAGEPFPLTAVAAYTYKAYTIGQAAGVGIQAQANCNNGTLNWTGVIDGLIYYGIPPAVDPTPTPTPTITPTPEPFYVDCMHPVYIPDDPFADFNPPEFNGTVCYGIIPEISIELIDFAGFTEDIGIPEMEFCFEKYTFPSMEIADIYIPLELLLIPVVMFVIYLIMGW